MIEVARIGGLDFGEKTIGVALSDELGWTAQGLEVVRRKTLELDLARLGEIARQYGVERWVVGMPRNMNGTYGPRAEATRAFVTELETKLGLPVATYDERMTTMQATRTLLEADVSRAKRKQVIDKMAAAVILQSYMDAERIRKAREEATERE
ncbi:MAG TPA: Holliday junction resolvase RuvX [Symbiobacteriaceae bacterium]|nr:Holliday junction resolvase RuvX [Symbiobacteriaceae bacterium]